MIPRTHSHLGKNELEKGCAFARSAAGGFYFGLATHPFSASPAAFSERVTSDRSPAVHAEWPRLQPKESNTYNWLPLHTYIADGQLPLRLRYQDTDGRGLTRIPNRT